MLSSTKTEGIYQMRENKFLSTVTRSFYLQVTMEISPFFAEVGICFTANRVNVSEGETIFARAIFHSYGSMTVLCVKFVF